MCVCVCPYAIATYPINNFRFELIKVSHDKAYTMAIKCSLQNYILKGMKKKFGD